MSPLPQEERFSMIPYFESSKIFHKRCILKYVYQVHPEHTQYDLMLFVMVVEEIWDNVF